ncbi:triose-phosphate isomerase [Candidatus Kaiserbacteria bacterium]|nr:triose-phosphate isomerase [Candidatus Kaiserbacteria bacterium]
MISVKKKIIVANWKMNPVNIAAAKKLFTGIKEIARNLSKVQTIIAPPAPYLSELTKLYKGHRILFSGQDIFWEEKGSFTGEISGTMLKDLGAACVIIGHSERRARGESNEDIHKKIQAVLQTGLTAILCIGESDRDHKDGTHLAFLTSQLESALGGISKGKLSKVVIAYEPIWAIGKSKDDAMKPEELHETVLFIKKVVTNSFGKSAAFKVPILYGGSVEKDNAGTLLTEGMVDGLLVGHASLSVREFGDILRSAQEVS